MIPRAKIDPQLTNDAGFDFSPQRVCLDFIFEVHEKIKMSEGGDEMVNPF